MSKSTKFTLKDTSFNSRMLFYFVVLYGSFWLLFEFIIPIPYPCLRIFTSAVLLILVVIKATGCMIHLGIDENRKLLKELKGRKK